MATNKDQDREEFEAARQEFWQRWAKLWSGGQPIGDMPPKFQESFAAGWQAARRAPSYDWCPECHARESAPSVVPAVQEGFTMDRIAEACAAVEISDSKFEALSIELLYSAAPSTPAVTVTLKGNDAVEERIKTLMAQIGMPNSTSLYSAMKQLQNEIEQGVMVDYAGSAQAGECEKNLFSSAICEKGTRGCHIDHKATADGAQADTPVSSALGKWESVATDGGAGDDTISLTKADAQFLIDLQENPPEPNAALKRAAARKAAADGAGDLPEDDNYVFEFSIDTILRGIQHDDERAEFWRAELDEYIRVSNNISIRANKEKP